MRCMVRLMFSGCGISRNFASHVDCARGAAAERTTTAARTAAAERMAGLMSSFILVDADRLESALIQRSTGHETRDDSAVGRAGSVRHPLDGSRADFHEGAAGR